MNPDGTLALGARCLYRSPHGRDEEVTLLRLACVGWAGVRFLTGVHVGAVAIVRLDCLEVLE